MFSAPGYHAIRSLKKNEKARFSQGDVLVLFGELFSRGYANGLVEEAQKRGMKIIRATVGRREKDGTLRPLNNEELQAHPIPLINVPLEAGFDLEPALDGLTPVDRLKEVKLSEWESCHLDEKLLSESRQKGRLRFQSATKKFMQELKPHLPKGRNVLFAHLMAGGVPRAKIIMPLMNRSVKGSGDRFMPSEKFWLSDLGRLCEMNFQEVTALTFETLINESQDIRHELEKNGNFCSYSAYGYHGTEVLIDNEYQWQTYSPYLQGWAKMALENISREAGKKGIRSCVYNCPEILTNSSSIFQGVEIPLYPLLSSLKKENPHAKKYEQVRQACQALLKPEISLEHLLEFCQGTLKNPDVRKHCVFEKWPQHSSQPQLETILETSDRLSQFHLDPKHLMTFVLSEIVFSSCGIAMLEDVAFPEASVSWLNHDLVAHAYLES